MDETFSALGAWYCRECACGYGNGEYYFPSVSSERCQDCGCSFVGQEQATFSEYRRLRRPPRRDSAAAAASLSFVRPVRPSTSTSDVMTLDEVRSALGLSPRDFQALLFSGELPGAERDGEAIKLSRRTMTAWLRASTPPKSADTNDPLALDTLEKRGVT